MASTAIFNRRQQQESQARARDQLGKRIIGCDVRNPDIGNSPISGDPTSVYDHDIGADFNFFSSNIGCDVRNSDVGKTPISGDPTSVYDPDIGFTRIRYQVYPMSGSIRYWSIPRYPSLPDIGYTPISGTFKNIPDIGYTTWIHGCWVL
jgi:hypothetical protein